MRIDNQHVNKGLNYILNNLYHDLSVDDVANYCNISKYHYNRLFKKSTGESVYAFIRRLKIEKSTLQIKIDPHKSLTHIGYDFGYSPGNYSKIFKNLMEQTPSSFRQKTLDYTVKSPYNRGTIHSLYSYDDYNNLIEIKEFPDTKVLYHRYFGSYQDIKSKWKIFTDTYKEYLSSDSLLIERTYDDPTVTNKQKCMYDICMSIPMNLDHEDSQIIPGGLYAVLHYDGPIDQMYLSFQGLFRVWLPKSGYYLDNRYGFDIYRAHNSKAMTIKFDLCIPISKSTF
ncbi:GyrI-like domain-containing protein [Erysipelothrix urinaevulpis]|uniref:AraC family transcriptional regulator n=1 Tax=Erysipelothrix urinaevulpis TaxID=2683717 RepID=UPI00135B4AEC|nr:GyrI-like domain-containing protein [Erysipelothrix urinaevulpis]